MAWRRGRGFYPLPDRSQALAMPETGCISLFGRRLPMPPIDGLAIPFDSVECRHIAANLSSSSSSWLLLLSFFSPRVYLSVSDSPYLWLLVADLVAVGERAAFSFRFSLSLINSGDIPKGHTSWSRGLVSLSLFFLHQNDNFLVIKNRPPFSPLPRQTAASLPHPLLSLSMYTFARNRAKHSNSPYCN